MTAIIAGISDVVSVVGTVFTAITGNELLVFFLAAGVLGVGIGAFARLKRIAK